MFAVTLIVIISAIIAIHAEEYPKVRVEVFYEALCPGCQDFITGPLTNVLALPDMVAIIDLKMVPYGNTKKSSDGTFTCQHGADECTSDVIELCTLYKLTGNITHIDSGVNSISTWPFIQCMEINHGASSYAESCYASTMSTSSLSWSTITDCAAKEELDVQNEGAVATPTHDYVPWVLVDKTLLSNTNALLISVCKSYTGPKPASCTRAMAKKSEVCMNN